MEQSVVNIDNCMICGVVMGFDRNELTLVLEFCRKPLYLLIEEFTETAFSEEIVNEAAICNRCLMKFNEFDEYQKLSHEIKKEISNLFLTHINTAKEEAFDEESLPMKEELNNSSNDLVYQDYEALNSLEDEADDLVFITRDDDIIITEEVDGNFEISEIDRKNLPRKFQKFQKAEKQKVIKTRTVKAENEYIVVQLDNLMLYQCEICQRTFKERSKLKAHKQIHTTERKIVCPICGKAFKTAACLRSHRRVHNPTVIECDYCGKTYTQKPELVKHINVIHLNRRDYVCEYCNAGFGCRGHLKAHYLTHQQFKGVQCSICNYTFHTKAKLDRHMRSHTGERDFQCGICGKSFLYSYNVSAHIRHVHWKEKRKGDEKRKDIKAEVICNICEERFSNEINLRKHLDEIHSGMSVTITDDENIIQYEDEVYLESY